MGAQLVQPSHHSALRGGSHGLRWAPALDQLKFTNLGHHSTQVTVCLDQGEKNLSFLKVMQFDSFCMHLFLVEVCLLKDTGQEPSCIYKRSLYLGVYAWIGINFVLGRFEHTDDGKHLNSN